jgi:hypothetical protein
MCQRDAAWKKRARLREAAVPNVSEVTVPAATAR